MQEGQKIRIALGVFEDLSGLKRAISEFQAFGLDVGQTVVLADSAGRSRGFDREFRALWAGGHENAPELLIRGDPPNQGNRFVDGIPGVVPAFRAEQLMNFEGWIDGKLSAELNKHLTNGCCVLFAPVSNVQHEWRVSNTLLKHSVGAVQLHDLSPRS